MNKRVTLLLKHTNYKIVSVGLFSMICQDTYKNFHCI